MALDTAIQNLVNRLEQVTARLERVEKQLGSGTTAAPGASVSSAAGSSADVSSHPSIVEYDDLVKEYINKYVELSNKVGGDVAAQVC